MKVLIDHHLPFLVAHGGFQIQIEQTKLALEKVGVEVDYLRWWEQDQRADVIHYFGRPWALYLQNAQKKGYKVVLADLLSALGSRPKLNRMVQKTIKRLARGVAGDGLFVRLGWDCFVLADACLAGTAWEAKLMTEMFDAPPERVHVLPNGVEDVFLESKRVPRGPWLVCTATITERKRTLELAQAAVEARTPVWIIGRPYTDTDPYALKFLGVARQHPDLVRFEGPIGDRAKLAAAYREARGFVLLSTMESLSLSSFEAAACECPLLLSDLPWARYAFGDKASYCPIAATRRTAAALRRFYDAAPSLPIPPRPATWVEIGAQLKRLYESLLR